MTVKTTLSFTDRHHHFLSEKVGEGVFATQSAAVAAALEQMMQDDQERDVALSANRVPPCGVAHGRPDGCRRAELVNRPARQAG